MQTNTQADVADSPIQSEVVKDNQFRIDAAPPGSALLAGDAAAFNVAGMTQGVFYDGFTRDLSA